MIRCHPWLHLLLLFPLSVYGATPFPVEGTMFTKTTSAGTASCRPPDGAEISRDVTSPSEVQCGQRCVEEGDRCQAAAFSPRDATCLLYAQPWDPAQCSVLGDWRTFVKGDNQTVVPSLCKNGGTPKSDGISCQCYGGYVGDTCERHMEDCLEAKQSGHYPDLGSGNAELRWLWAKPLLALQPIEVNCLSSGQTVFQRQQRKFTNFNRTWQEYVDGFGDKDSYWMGLRDLYTFTNSKPYHLEFNFLLQINRTRRTFSYLNFALTDNVTYTAQLGDYKPGGALPGHVGDMNGQAFSAFDKDNDNNASVNCAEAFGGGWWFSQACAEVNINGNVEGVDVWSGNVSAVHYKGLGDVGIKSLNLRLVTA